MELKLKQSSVIEFQLKEVENQEKIYRLESDLSTRRNEIQEKSDKATTHKIKKAQLDEMKLNKIRELERLTKELVEISIKKDNLKKEIQEAKTNNEQCFREVVINNDRRKVAIRNY